MEMRTTERKDHKLVVRYGSIIDDKLVYICTEGESYKHLNAQDDVLPDEYAVLTGSTALSQIGVIYRTNLEKTLDNLQKVELMSYHNMKRLNIEIKPEGLLVLSQIDQDLLKYGYNKLFKLFTTDEHRGLCEEDHRMNAFFAHILAASNYHGDDLPEAADSLKSRLRAFEL